MKENYLITGGTGFIGTYVTQRLIQEEENVVIYDAIPRKDFLEMVLGNKRGDAKIVKGDILDLANIIRIAQTNNITKIIHMAALLTLESSENPAMAVRINNIGTINILETVRILGLKKVVFASSNAVFGPAESYKQEIIPESAAHYPTSIYGACKSFNERVAEHYNSEYGIDTVGLRFPPVYGIGHRTGASALLTKELIINPALGKPGYVPFGNDIINWLYVKDAARAVFLVCKKPRISSKVFNIGGECCSVSKAVEIVKKIIPNANISILAGYTGFTAKYDYSRISEEIGFKPHWNLEEGFKQVIDEIREMHRNGLIGEQF